MYKIIRFFNQNRRAIITIILIIVFILLLLQILNRYYGKKTDIVQNNENSNENLVENSSLISDESLVTGNKVSKSELKNSTNLINEFVDYCNKGDINSAYNMISDECKEEMFPTIDDFENIYYSSIFNGSSKNCTIENWNKNIYLVRITEDVLTTGRLDNGTAKQDYITINSDKLNINSYVGRTQLEQKNTYKDVDIDMVRKDTYMDYEIYTIQVKNNSNNTILVDEGNDSKSVYLLDENDMKYYFYNNEIISSNLIVPSGYTRTLKIKFSNSYSSNRNIKCLVFSKFIFNYDDYKNDEGLQDKLIETFRAYV